jgi:hypothetical protein
MKIILRVFMLVGIILHASLSYGQNGSVTTSSSTAPKEEKKEAPKKWYDKISLRGYAQIRYNRLLETNGQLKCEQCDRSWGENGGFFY